MSKSTSPPLRMGMSSGGGMTGEEARDKRSAVRRLLGYLAPYRPQLLVVAAFVVVTTALNLTGPILLGRAIDDYVIPGDLSGLSRLALIMLAVYGVAGITHIVQGVLMTIIGQRLVADVSAASSSTTCRGCR